MNETLAIKKYAYIVDKVAYAFKRRTPDHVEVEDLRGAGMLGLLDGLRKHGDKLAEIELRKYLWVRVRGAILDELRTQDWLPRRARKDDREVPKIVSFNAYIATDESTSYTLGDILKDERPSPEDVVDQVKEFQALLQAVNTLPQRERDLVLKTLQGVKQETLAKELGVSEPRISQLHARAVEYLRAKLGKAA